MGVGNLAEYFKKGTAVEVTGKIEKYKDKKTSRDRYEMKVKDPDKVKRR